MELVGGHGGVFGGVEAAAEVAGHVGEALEEGEGKAFLDGEIEGEGDAGLGEAHEAGRRDIAESLEHGEEGGETGFGDLGEDGDGAFAGGLPGDGVLELQEAGFAVHAVPVEGDVEGVEEGFVVLVGFDAGLHLLVEVGEVEGGYGVLVEGKPGASKGKTSLGSGEMLSGPGVLVWSPSMKMPRAKFLPVEAQSIQETVYSMSA